MSGRALYEARVVEMLYRGVRYLRLWRELPPSIRAAWNERAEELCRV